MPLFYILNISTWLQASSNEVFKVFTTFSCHFESSMIPNLINKKTITTVDLLEHGSEVNTEWAKFSPFYPETFLRAKKINWENVQKLEKGYPRPSDVLMQPKPEHLHPVLYLYFPTASMVCRCQNLDSQVSGEIQHAYFIHTHLLVMYGRLGRYTRTAAVCLSNGGGNSSNYRQGTTLMLL